MIAQTVAVLFATHVGLGVYSDILGYTTALREYESARKTDPITCGDPPCFNWQLFAWRIAGGFVAAALALVGISPGGAQ